SAEKSATNTQFPSAVSITGSCTPTAMKLHGGLQSTSTRCPSLSSCGEGRAQTVVRDAPQHPRSALCPSGTLSHLPIAENSRTENSRSPPMNAYQTADLGGFWTPASGVSGSSRTG